MKDGHDSQRTRRFHEAEDNLPFRALCELTDWLSDPRWEWSYFCTLTFGPAYGPSGPHPDRAMALGESWLRSVPEIRRWYLCCERGKLGRTHLHALTHNTHLRGSARSLSAEWRFRFDSRSHFRRYAPHRGAEYYLGKYLLKAPLHWTVEDAGPDP